MISVYYFEHLVFQLLNLFCDFKYCVILSLLLQPVLYHNWEIHIQYSIHGQGSDGLHGDGIAFWYVKEPGTLGEWFTFYISR